MFGKCLNEIHIKHKSEEISEETFEYKGCWNCEYFEYGDNFPYYDVEEASQQIGVSKSTIIRWIKAGKLSGRLFIIGESKFVLGSWKKYYIDKNEVDTTINELGTSNKDMRKIRVFLNSLDMEDDYSNGKL